jgi:aspartyl-tRNA(Asn)/glutamyl-tRNA(Gln) amidotransferase subunit B
VRRVIAANPNAVAQYKKGKTAAANSFIGAVMRETKGGANADAVRQLILEELQKA